MVDAAGELTEPVAMAAPAPADDLRGDRDSGLFRRPGAKIKSDRTGEAANLDPRSAPPRGAAQTFLCVLP